MGNVFKIKIVLLLIIIINANSSGTQFFDYFVKGTDFLYKDDQVNFGKMQQKNANWFVPLNLYRNFWQGRLNNFTNRDDLLTLLQKKNEFSKNDLAGTTDAEINLLNGLFLSMQASLEAENSFFTPLKNGNKALNYFQLAQKSYPDEAAFGIGAANLTAVLFFDNNFMVRSLLGFRPSLWQGIKLLNQSALQSELSQVEAILYLVEYYAGIEENFRRAIVYSTLLIKKYPNNSYFNFLHGKNLFRLNQYSDAKNYLHKSNRIGNKFYPFQYQSLIMEAECYYNLVLIDEANNLAEFAGSILAGQDYYKLKFKLLVLKGQSLLQIKKAIPGKIYKTIAVDYPVDIQTCRQYLLREIAIKQAGSADNLQSLLISINNFEPVFRDKLLLLMQDFVLSLDLDKTEQLKVVNKLSSLINDRQAKALSELYKIKIELYNRNFDNAKKIFDQLDNSIIDKAENSRRVKIWRRICQ